MNGGPRDRRRKAITQPGGRPHAEPVALAAAGAAARGATLYVTLEPCSHHGRTPPCADAILAPGVARVVTALEDPDPRVERRRAMRGSRAAGVAVTTGVLARGGPPQSSRPYRARDARPAGRGPEARRKPRTATPAARRPRGC